MLNGVVNPYLGIKVFAVATRPKNYVTAGESNFEHVKVPRIIAVSKI
jgi:hypothetical protein